MPLPPNCCPIPDVLESRCLCPLAAALCLVVGCGPLQPCRLSFLQALIAIWWSPSLLTRSRPSYLSQSTAPPRHSPPLVFARWSLCRARSGPICRRSSILSCDVLVANRTAASRAAPSVAVVAVEARSPRASSRETWAGSHNRSPASEVAAEAWLNNHTSLPHGTHDLTSGFTGGYWEYKPSNGPIPR